MTAPTGVSPSPLVQHQQALRLATRGPGFVDITRAVATVVADSGITTGLATVFLRHTSASLVIQENADPDVLADLGEALARLAPEDPALYRHRSEGPDDMPAHLRSVLTGVSLQVPIADGVLALGTWQGLYIAEHRRGSHHRSLIVHLLGQ